MTTSSKPSLMPWGGHCFTRPGNSPSWPACSGLVCVGHRAGSTAVRPLCGRAFAAPLCFATTAWLCWDSPASGIVSRSSPCRTGWPGRLSQTGTHRWLRGARPRTSRSGCREWCRCSFWACSAGATSSVDSCTCALCSAGGSAPSQHCRLGCGSLPARSGWSRRSR